MPWEQVGREIRHRIRDTQDFEPDSFRTQPVEGVRGEGITPLMARSVFLVLGRLTAEAAERIGRTPGTMAPQSIRFRTEIQQDGQWVPTGWTLEKAQAWWAEHGESFERAAPVVDVETRAIEIRAEGEGDGTTLVGYAVRWNEPSQGLPFVERFAPGAFRQQLATDADVLALLDHDRGKVLGRRSNGTLTLLEDDEGLRVVIRPNVDTSWGRDALAAVRRGDLRQMSVGFRAVRDKWDGDVRTVEQAELVEVSVVSMPAYPTTSVAVRHLGGETMEKTTVDVTLATPAPQADERRAAWVSYLRGEPYDVRALGVGPSGGGAVLAPEGFVREVIRKLNEQAVMRRIARVLTVTTATARIPRNLSGVAAAWLGENQAITPSDPTFDQVEFRPHKLGALTLVSNELLADAGIDVEQLLSDLFAEALAQLEDAAYFGGDGAGKPSGILLDASIADVDTDGSTVEADDVLAVYDALPPQYRPEAVWVMNPATMSVLRQLKDSAGNYLLVDGLAGAAPTTLLGRPVYLSSHMPTIAAGNRVILFGDVRRAYAIVDRQGLEIQRSTDRYFEADQTAFRAIARTDGRVVLPEAVRFLKVTS